MYISLPNNPPILLFQQSSSLIDPSAKINCVQDKFVSELLKMDGGPAAAEPAGCWECSSPLLFNNENQEEEKENQP